MGYAEAQFAVDGILDGINGQARTGLEPNNVLIKVAPGNQQVKICFEARDTIIFEQTIATVKGVMLRRKLGSAPLDLDDGDLIGDFQGDELISHRTMDNPIVDTGLYNDNRYYYRFFPYSGSGVVNYSANNIVSVVPRDAIIWGFHQDFQNLDPETTISYIADAVGFTPAHHNLDTGVVTNGSWDDWEWLNMNKPYIVNGGGRANYMLDPNNYAKRASGLDSDIYDDSGAFGCFSWIPKIYMKEVYAADGNSRDVYFAMNNTSSRTSDFLPVGFYSDTNEILEGVWLPMYYADANGLTIAGSTPGWTLGTQYKNSGDPSCIDDLPTMEMNIRSGFSSAGYFLGGPILSVLRDILYMMYKSTNIRYHGAEGRINSNTVVANRSGAIHDGQFYGRNQAAGELGRAFHSEVLYSYQRAIVDPYTICCASKKRITEYGSDWGLNNPTILEMPYYRQMASFRGISEGYLGYRSNSPYSGTNVGEYGPTNTLEGYNACTDVIDQETEANSRYRFASIFSNYFSNGYTAYSPSHLTPMTVNKKTLTSTQKTTAGITNSQSTSDNMKLDIVPMSIKNTSLVRQSASLPRGYARNGLRPDRNLGLCTAVIIRDAQLNNDNDGVWLPALRLGGCSSQAIESSSEDFDITKGKLGSDYSGPAFMAFTDFKDSVNIGGVKTGQEWGYACLLLPPVGYTPENVE